MKSKLLSIVWLLFSFLIPSCTIAVLTMLQLMGLLSCQALSISGLPSSGTDFLVFWVASSSLSFISSFGDTSSETLSWTSSRKLIDKLLLVSHHTVSFIVLIIISICLFVYDMTHLLMYNLHDYNKLCWLVHCSNPSTYIISGNRVGVR